MECFLNRKKTLLHRAKRFFLLLLFSIAAAPGALAAEKKITLEAFVRMAAERNTVFEEILIDELPLQYTRTLALPADDLILSVKGMYVLMLEDPDGGTEYSFELDKLFPATGTRLSTSYAVDYGFGSRRNESEFSIAVVQPVAENAFGKANRLTEKLSGIENEVARYQIAEAYEDYLAGLVRLYYDWYAASENLATAATAYEDARKQLDNIRERARNSIALPIDINKIMVQTVSRKEQMIALKNNYDAQTNLVMEAIRATETGRPAPAPPDKPHRGMTKDLESELRSFRESSRTASILALLEEKAGTAVARSADKLLPSIDLTAGYNLLGDDRFFTELDHGLFGGIVLEWPLPDKQEAARHEISRINQRRVSLSTGNTMLSLETALKNLYRTIENQYRLIELAEEKIAISQAIVRDEKKNYSLGKTDLNELIDEVNRLEERRFNLINREIELQKLIVEWKRLTDTLVQEKNIAGGNRTFGSYGGAAHGRPHEPK